MEIVIILCLILLNGVLSLSEIALISARKSKLETDARRGSASARTALSLSENPDKFLSTIQIGITLIGILTGLYSGDVFAQDVSVLMAGIGVPEAYSLTVAKIVIVVIVTYLTIIFGELIPKRIGMTAAEKAAKAIARPMKFISVIASPFVWILSKSTGFFFRLLKLSDADGKVTEEEIKSLVRESKEDGEIEEVEQNIVERVFNLGDRDLGSIMTHRGDIEWLDVDMTADQIREMLDRSLHDIYPVADGSLDKLLGVVFLKDMFMSIGADDFCLRTITREAHYFHEDMSVYAALEHMKSEKLKYALISDEFGDFQGIITLKDILEALVGTMPELGEEQDIVMREDGSWLIDGQCPFYDFLAHFKLEDMYTEYDLHTLGGLILELLGRIPHTGEVLEWQSLRLEVVDMDGARIDKVLVTAIATDGTDSSESAS